MRRYVVPFLFLLFAQLSIAQQHEVKYCGQTEATERLFKRFPMAQLDADLANRKLEKETEEAHYRSGGNDEVYIIPVVFHVIHNYGPENISDEQIYDAVDILNRDFRKLNSDTSLIVDAFADIAADIDVEFRLATLDPEGNCHPGINRIVSAETYVGDNDELSDLVSWPRNSYLQVWVVSYAAGAAGYTNLPGSVNNVWAASGDGIVLKSDYCGSIGTSSIGRSRTLTHEVGHWLNLYHAWGSGNNPGQSGNCNMDDLVSDTPNTIGWSTCDLDGASCGNDIDNVQNYMEYSYCSRMFTEGQRTRMRAALTSSVAQRNQLWTTANLIETGVFEPVLCEALFAIDRPTVCVGETIQFTDLSYHGVTSWDWSFGDGNTLAGTDAAIYQNPTHTFESPGLYTITLTVGNGEENVSTVQEDFIMVLPAGVNDHPFSEGFENTFPDDNWHIYNQNSDLTWTVVTTAAYTGSKSLKLSNWNNDLLDNTDELISATFDLSEMDTVWLSYKWAYANKINETDDRLRVSVSGSCGSEWYLKKVHKGLTDLPSANPINSAFTPSSTDQWNSNTLVLDDEDWMTDKFRFKFEFVAKGGNNIYLDDINLFAVDNEGVFVGEISPAMALQVFPNPSDGNMTVQLFTQNNEATSINLYNNLGQVCRNLYNGSIGAGNHIFELEGLTSGMYTLVVNQGDQTMTRKVVIR
jgi:PKD repeat protein